RVVLATPDPNPYVNGKGILILKKHGIQVDVGLLKKEASLLNEKYIIFMRTGRPFIHLKIAQSLDGRIATQEGQSRWITNENALKTVHRLRSEYDAVLVGIKTVIKDNPSLTVRHLAGRNPFRIILDDKLVIPENARVISDKGINRTIIFTTVEENDPGFARLSRRGIRLIQVGRTESGYINLPEVMAHLATLNITSLLVEGGGEVFTSFIKSRLFDKITFFIAPMMIGTGIQSIGDLNITSLEEATRLQDVQIDIIDNQAVITGYQNFESITG
ncbi:MAG: bifunctional diaminohydroxyphosphoribosylaminopyrimidine deaminase/5-amino-6-(5-phosphoribosylamino)uracil reductase RibD, partial [Calditrichaeota bacterium]